MTLPLDTVVIIPARRGSKGIPGKNWRNLGGKPLISYAIEVALEVATPEQICVTTDAPEIIEIAQFHGVDPGCKRPATLCSDTADTRSAVLHALDHWETRSGRSFQHIVLLQPTSPFRRAGELLDAMALMGADVEMVVSAVETPDNPYYTVYIPEENGKIRKAIPSSYTRRQDCPKALVLDGAIYVMRVEALRDRSPGEFTEIRCLERSRHDHVDLDTERDWAFAEFLLSRGLITQA